MLLYNKNCKLFLDLGICKALYMSYMYEQLHECLLTQRFGKIPTQNKFIILQKRFFSPSLFTYIYQTSVSGEFFNCD